LSHAISDAVTKVRKWWWWRWWWHTKDKAMRFAEFSRSKSKSFTTDSRQKWFGSVPSFTDLEIYHVDIKFPKFARMISILSCSISLTCSA